MLTDRQRERYKEKDYRQMLTYRQSDRRKNTNKGR